MRNKHFVDTSHGPGRTAMINVGISLIDLQWMRVGRFLTVESEPPSTDCRDHDRLAR